MRTGKEYVDSLNDGRKVYINGIEVSDVREHPAFKGIIETLSGMYDFSSDPDNGMIFKTEWGSEGNNVFIIPRTKQDQADRHEAIYKWAKLTAGFVGRSPDHVGGFLAGFAGKPEVFARGKPEFADNVINFYHKVVSEDLYVTYAIIPPQNDRSKTAQDQENRFTQVGVLSENDKGIVIRGAQMLGTGSAVSDYIFVSCIPPLKPGDEDYALSFALPVNAKGLKLYCRKPYAVDKSGTFDYPMSTRFDESDAFLVFDDVFVPWENVFVYRDISLLQAQFFETAAHVLGNNQAQIRLSVKMKFLIGIARKVTAMNGIDKIPGVVEKLGELASLSSIVEGMVQASESTAMERPAGVISPNPRFLYGAMGMQADLYPRALHILRELCGAGVLQLPSSIHEMINPETRDDISTYIRSSNATSEERIKLFRLAWDVIGSEFAGRHHQYEMFYAGAPFVAKNYSFRNYGYDEPVEMVDSFMHNYDFSTGASEKGGKN
ncbi:4-hydroxyphenylacetate 3-hydroxylase [uncultured archaeon]|nr:4-hydroxyphenylacetate 3-hydroxylase [uncultured archaeon]